MASLVCPLVVSGLWLCVHVSVVLIVLHEDVLLPQHPQHGHTSAVVTQLVKLEQTTTICLRIRPVSPKVVSQSVR